MATFTVNDALTILLSADYGKQKNAFVLGDSAKWSGIAGYFNYALNSEWRVSIRAEYMKDSDGFISGVTDNKIKEATVTFGYAPTKNFELRFEGRVDKTTDDYFLKDNDGTLSSNQSHFLIEGLYKFPAPTG